MPARLPSSCDRPEPAELARDANLAEAIIPLFARTAQQAIRPGLLHGYCRQEDTLTTIRGRVRVAEQFRARTGLPLPIEVVYDDFTPDILENRQAWPAAIRWSLWPASARGACARPGPDLPGEHWPAQVDRVHQLVVGRCMLIAEGDAV